MLFNKKDKDNEQIALEIPASAGMSLQRILCLRLSELEKQKIDMVTGIQNHSLANIDAENYYLDLISIRNLAIDIENLLILIRTAVKNSKPNMYVCNIPKQAFINLSHIVTRYKDTCVKDFTEYHSKFKPSDVSLQQLIKEVEEYNNCLRDAVEAESFIEKYKG